MKLLRIMFRTFLWRLWGRSWFFADRVGFHYCLLPSIFFASLLFIGKNHIKCICNTVHVIKPIVTKNYILLYSFKVVCRPAETATFRALSSDGLTSVIDSFSRCSHCLILMIPHCILIGMFQSSGKTIH